METKELIEKVQELFANNNGGFKTQEQVSEMKVKEFLEFLSLNGMRLSFLTGEPETVHEVEDTLIIEDEIVIPLTLATGHTLDYMLEEEVFLRTDPNQYGRLITGIILLPQNSVVYKLSFDTTSSVNYAFEMDIERDIIKATSS